MRDMMDDTDGLRTLPGRPLPGEDFAAFRVRYCRLALDKAAEAGLFDATDPDDVDWWTRSHGLADQALRRRLYAGGRTNDLDLLDAMLRAEALTAERIADAPAEPGWTKPTPPAFAVDSSLINATGDRLRALGLCGSKMPLMSLFAHHHTPHAEWPQGVLDMVRCSIATPGGVRIEDYEVPADWLPTLREFAATVERWAPDARQVQTIGNGRNRGPSGYDLFVWLITERGGREFEASDRSALDAWTHLTFYPGMEVVTVEEGADLLPDTELPSAMGHLTTNGLRVAALVRNSVHSNIERYTP